MIAYSTAPAGNSAGAGYAMNSQYSLFTTAGSEYMTTNTESTVVTTTGTSTPQMTGNSTRLYQTRRDSPWRFLTP
jgi:hypothetical protein